MPQETAGPPESINPEMITLAREARGMTQAELADALGVTQSRLSKIEAGLLDAPPALVGALAIKLRYPEAFFGMTERRYGIGISEYYHRKRQKLGVRVLDAIHARLEVIRIQVGRLLRAVQITSDYDFPHFDIEDFDNDAAEVARAARAYWKLPTGPITSVVKVIEDAGGIVIRVNFETRLLDAVSRPLPNMPPLFFSNDSVPADRERWTLAHEVGHIIMHSSAHPEMEEQANKFASEFLMPASEIKASLYNVTLPKLAALKRVWRVSMAALLYRAKDLATINERRYRFLNMQLARAGYKLREPVETEFPHEETSLLQTVLAYHIDELQFTIEDLTKLLVMHEPELRETYHLKPRVPQRGLHRVK